MVDPYAPPKLRLSDERGLDLVNKLAEELGVPVTSKTTDIDSNYGDYAPGPRKVKALVLWAKTRRIVA